MAGNGANGFRGGSPPAHVVVADGHTLTRLGVAAFVENEDDLRLVGETGREEELLRLVRDLGPSLVILDMNLDGGPDRFGICCRMKAMAHPPRVLAHTAHELSDDAAACLLAADAHVHKGACRAIFAATVRRLVSGTPRAPGTAESVPDVLGAGARPTHPLTDKERQIAAMMLLRYSNPEMARALHVSLPTVKTHVRSILRKLGAKNRRELLGPQALGA